MKVRKYNKIPDKEKEPFTYKIWKEKGMLKMNPSERVLMHHLSEMASVHKWLYGDDWWKIKDMIKFVKFIIPKIKKEEQDRK